MRVLTPILVSALALGACAPAEEPPLPTGEGEEATPATMQPEEQIGGCILARPVGDVPDDLYRRTPVTTTEAYPAFTKMLVVRGITLVADDRISDPFLELVADTVEEIFPRDEDLDLEAQAELIRNLYRYRTVIPVVYGRFEGVPEEIEAEWDETASRNSVCDIIMEDVTPGQVMEVVEHILHFVSDVGLHYTFPDTWGISEESVVGRQMQEAIDQGYYVIDQYDDLDDERRVVRQRVLVQEFAYWVISTAWNLQADYGPVGEAEWNVTDEADLRAKLPDLYTAYEQTVATVMTPPSRETLEAIGPTRAEERDRE